MSYLKQHGPARTFVTLEPYTRQGYVAHCIDCKRPDDLISLTLKCTAVELEPCTEAAELHVHTVHHGMTRRELIQHILDEHKMGRDGARVFDDPALSDVWLEIRHDPQAWHAEDHRVHGPSHDQEWN